MKHCPRCHRTYSDELYSFCLEDGALLSAKYDPDATQRLQNIHYDDIAPTERIIISPDAQIDKPSEYNKVIFTPVIIIGLLLFGLAVWVFQLSGTSSRPIANTVSATSTAVNTQNSSSTNSDDMTAKDSKPSPSPTLNSNARTDVQAETPTVTNVLLTYFTSAKVYDEPLPNESVTLQVQGKSFNAQTNGKGIAAFNGVPCGKTVKIIFHGYPEAQFTRYLKCGPQFVQWKYYANSFALSGEIEIEQVK